MRLIRSLSRRVPVLVFGLVISTTLMGQKGGGGSGGGGSKPGPVPGPPIASTPTVNPTVSNPFPFSIPISEPCRELSPCDGRRKQLTNEQPPCFKWPFSPLSGSTVSVSRLAVPAKAKKEFEEACGLAHGQHAKAEEHLRKATDLHPQYAEAWMLLGQFQLEQNQKAEAAESCQHALDSDREYLPPYLCLAILASKQEKWDLVSRWTSQALDLHPVKAPGAYYYNALAHLRLHELPAAEKSAARAVAQSGRDQVPEVHYLLAMIFEAKKDRAGEAAELRQYLKLAPHASDAVLVKNILRQIDEQATGSSAALTPKADLESK